MTDDQRRRLAAKEADANEGSHDLDATTQDKKVLTLEDYGQWNRINSTAPTGHL